MKEECDNCGEMNILYDVDNCSSFEIWKRDENCDSTFIKECNRYSEVSERVCEECLEGIYGVEL